MSDFEVQPAKEGYFLRGHVFKTFMVQRESTCEIRCFAEHGCVSYNTAPSHEDGSYVCELSDSDHEMHPEALERRNGFSYRTTEVIIKYTKALHQQLHKTGENVFFFFFYLNAQTTTYHNTSHWFSFLSCRNINFGCSFLSCRGILAAKEDLKKKDCKNTLVNLVEVSSPF